MKLAKTFHKNPREIAETIKTELEKDYVSGITFSGGDPLHPANINEITELAATIRQIYPHKTIWLYTGYEWNEVK